MPGTPGGGESAEQTYDRGAAAGRVLQRLEGYDIHFKTINGSVEKTARELERLTIAIERLEQQASARDAKALALAAALKEAEQAYRDRNTDKWSPLTRLVAIVTIVVGLVTLYIQTRT